MSSGSDDSSSESDSESEMKDDVQTLNDERNETLTKKLLGENIFKQKHYELEEAEYARLTNIHKQNAVQTKNNEKYMREHDSFILGTINNRVALNNLRAEIREQLNVGDTPNLIDHRRIVFGSNRPPTFVQASSCLCARVCRIFSHSPRGHCEDMGVCRTGRIETTRMDNDIYWQ